MSPAEAALALVRTGLLLAEAVVFGSLVVRALGGQAQPGFDLRNLWWALAVLGPVWVLLQAVVLGGVSLLPLVLSDTRVGHVALLRGVLWAVAAWVSPRRIAVVPAGVAMALHAAAGHATADGDAWLQMSVLAHVVAAGAWIGGLPALWVALGDQDASALVRRFAVLGLVCVIVLAATAMLQGLDFAGGLPGLVGTPYGRLLLVKSGLFACLLGLAVRNQFVLGHDSLRLRRSVAWEAVLGGLTLCAASLLSGLPPGQHEQPWWPFAWWPDLTILADDDLRAEVLDGVLALAGAAALLAAATWLRPGRVPLVLAAVGAAWLALPHLAVLLVPAEPTLFWESPSTATPSSIALGKAAYAEHCASCHGLSLRGDGAAGRALPIPPADLTAPHLWDHREGQLFWWLTDGMRGPDGTLVMPGFSSLDERTRWALVDFIRANNPYGATSTGVHRH